MPVPREQLFYEHEIAMFARHGPVFINLWRGIPTVELLEALAEHQLTMGTHVVLTIVQEVPKARMPGDAKDASTRAYDATKHLVRASASYVEGSGFFAAAVRAVMASSAMFQRASYPARVFSKLDDASQYLDDYAKPIDAGYEPTLLAHYAMRLTATRKAKAAAPT